MTTPTAAPASTAAAGQARRLSPGGGYAPAFDVRIEEAPVARADGTRVRDLRLDVLDLRLTLDLATMSHFALTLNNWNERQLRFTYSDSSGELFDLGTAVTIRVGYADQLVTVMKGIVTALSPTFPESGPSTIVVSGTDSMQKLKARKPPAGENGNYRNKTDWQIAAEVARRHTLAIDPNGQDGPVYELVSQGDRDDATFLLDRARRTDRECYLRLDPRTNRETLYFAPAADGRDGAPDRLFAVGYGPGLAGSADRATARAGGAAAAAFGPPPNLLSFTPTITAHDQVTSVTVHGWDSRGKKPITYTAKATDLPTGRGRSGPDVAASALGGRADIEVRRPIANRDEARALAVSLLRDRAYTFITASGRVAGAPELRPGDSLEVHGVGRRFSGVYYLTRVEHTLGSGGFFTTFTGRRTYDSPAGGAAGGRTTA